jgi:DegV family protein with EDD domain
VRVFGTLDTLDYLQRGGRIGSARALLGSLLSVKPIIEVRDGAVSAESRQRTRGRSFDYLVAKVRAAGKLRSLGVAHAAAPDVEDLLRALAELYPREDILVSYIGPVIGTHTGPRTVGVCYRLA